MYKAFKNSQRFAFAVKERMIPLCILNPTSRKGTLCSLWEPDMMDMSPIRIRLCGMAGIFGYRLFFNCLLSDKKRNI